MNYNNVQTFDWNAYEILYSYPPYLLKIVQSIAGIILFSLFFFVFFFYINPVKLQLQIPDCFRILFSYANYGYYCTQGHAKRFLFWFSPYEGIRIPESGKVSLVESGIRENLESWVLESGVQFKESRIRNPSSTTKNPESIIQDCLRFPYIGQCGSCSLMKFVSESVTCVWIISLEYSA